MNTASGSRDGLPGLGMPSSSGDTVRGSWLNRRGSRLRRSTAPVRRQSESCQQVHDVFTAEAPLKVPTVADAMGEYAPDIAWQARIGDCSPSSSRPISSRGTSPLPGSRRASIDGALGAPFTTPIAGKIKRQSTLRVRTNDVDRMSTTSIPRRPAPVASLYTEHPPFTSAPNGMTLAPVATSGPSTTTPPHTPLERAHRGSSRIEPSERVLESRLVVDRTARDSAPPTGISERTLESQSSADTNPDWLFDHMDGSASSHVSTPSLDIPEGGGPLAMTNLGTASSGKYSGRRPIALPATPYSLSPGGMPCRDLEQSWLHTPDQGYHVSAPEWDRYSHTSSDSVLSTPVQMSESIQHSPPTPLALQLVHTGAGHLSVVRPGQDSDQDVYREVTPNTTHLAMHACRIPPSKFSFLQIPTSLVVLDVSQMGLDQLPLWLAHCTSLEELNVSKNPLGSLIHWKPLSSLSNLRVLLADECDLYAVPEELRDVRNLQILGLRSNHLSYLPSWLYLLEKLGCLLLEGNDSIAPAWQPVLAALLEPGGVGVTSREALPTSPNSAASSFSTMNSTSSEAKRGLLHKALNIGRPRRSDKDDRIRRYPSNSSGSRLPNPEKVAPIGSMASSDSLRITSKSLITLLSHASPAKRSPLPSPRHPMRSSSTGAGSINSPNASMSIRPNSSSPQASMTEKGIIPHFLPVYPPREGEASRFVVSSSYVHDLLGYLADLDDLRPERQVAMHITSGIKVSTPRSPNTPILNGVSVAHSDEMPPSMASPLPQVSMEESVDGSYAIRESDQVKEDALRRQRLICEIVDTERTYVSNLTELMEIYVRRARQPLDGHSEERVLPIAKERAVFGHIEGIVHFHAHAFLPSLEKAALPALQGIADPKITAETAARVANEFTHHAAYFKMYMNYVNQYDSAVRHIARWSQPLPARARTGTKAAFENAGATLASLGHRLTLQQHPSESETGSKVMNDDWDNLPYARRRQIQAYLIQCREDPRHSQLNLEGYMLLPIQRIPRYRMLLEQLVRCTSPQWLSRDQLEAIPRALAHISLVASWVNEGKRQSEQGRRLLLWQSKLRGNFSAPLVQPHRRLVCDGPLRLRRVTRRADATDGLRSSVPPILEQTAIDQRVQLLLCNDLAAVVADPEDNAEEDLYDNCEPVAPLDPAEMDAIDLLAVLKPCVRIGPPGQPMVPPASVLDYVVLRVVDARYIFYFVANTHRDAVQWAHAINAHPGG
ncbi:hypothetical protein MPSI1_001239 [Malassezia psittaci]|uniref:DH domain-containing protein n=1 Tax=Malassezia psittaci TaxID=1821823 RepID=A0AAF0FD01_9BASI|nr:hypothetical protein MPSI1_001239 [Malassezia psittaci]